MPATTWEILELHDDRAVLINEEGRQAVPRQTLPETLAQGWEPYSIHFDISVPKVLRPGATHYFKRQRT